MQTIEFSTYIECSCSSRIYFRTFRDHQQQSFLKAPSLTIKCARAYKNTLASMNNVFKPISYIFCTSRCPLSVSARLDMFRTRKSHWNLKKSHESSFTSSLPSITMLHMAIVSQIRFPLVFLWLLIQHSSLKLQLWLRPKAPDDEKRPPGNDRLEQS